MQRLDDNFLNEISLLNRYYVPSKRIELRSITVSKQLNDLAILRLYVLYKHLTSLRANPT